MGKKKGKNRSPREDDDTEITGPSCKHIKKAADQTLPKKLAGDADWTSCQDCKCEENKENSITALPQDSGDEREPATVWMCLKCGHRGCGRNSENQHAIKHYETPRSETHCLVISLDCWSVWCYTCDVEVQYSITSHLAQLVTSLKKKTSSEPPKTPQIENPSDNEEQPEADEDKENENKENSGRQKKSLKKESVAKPQSPTAAAEDVGRVSVKGLSNLGNTCFFNAVIQNLSQTLQLRQTLNKVIEEKTSVNIEPVAPTDLEPIVVQKDQPGSLTLAMCELLNEIQGSKRGVVTPRELFSQVCKKAARFKGFQQQDSQELLRYLLDGMRAEEIKRISSGIMETLKLSRKGTESEQLKKLAKEYEKNGSPKNFVDQVFGGEMTSTVMCQQCKTVSVVTEMFLDLSLPVSDEAYRKKNLKKAFQKTSDSDGAGRESPAPNGNDDFPTGAGSKHQLKKAKKQAKKQAKQKKRQEKFESKIILSGLSSPSGVMSERADTPSGGGDAAHAGEREGDSAPFAVSEEDPTSLEADEEEGEESANECETPAGNRFTALSVERRPGGGGVSDEFSDAERADGADSQLASQMEQINLDDAHTDSEAAGRASEGEDEPPEAKEYTVINQDPELAFRTLAARSTPDKQECSVHSCLFQFTEVETLTHNNSLLCVTCTKRQANKDKAGSTKNIYTDALKQMLISSPPPVLTLHLKRFQQNGFSICKVNRHVHFPLVLDLAPFCAAKCKNLSEGDNQILYSLYGIVEHSGTMRSGHYTAYVKTRPRSSKPAANGVAGEAEVEPLTGSWFHISDTSVQPVSETKVQSCQAYLLFYERIL